MRDLMPKLRILWWFLADSFANWKSEIWEHDLDGRYCCDGRECCCGGMTRREMYGQIRSGETDYE